MRINRCFGCMSAVELYPCSNCGYDPEKPKAPDYVLRPGMILNGKYLVGRMLGQGGFGITYIGWDIALERKVAIKEFYPSGQVSRAPGTRNLIWYANDNIQSVQQNGMRAFLKEAQKMAKVDGLPNVVRILDLFQENETAYIVMDFVAGKTLKKALEETGPMDWEQAKDIFMPAIKAMEQVHRAGLVHRDLSPDNLILTPDGGVMILDLGAAKDLNINSGASSALVAKGGFSPLEQYGQRGGSGTWTDVYAMAATIYYALTGMLPPTAVDRITEDTIRWDYPRLQSLPAPVLKTLKNAMAILVNDRTKTMAELERGLFAETTKRKSKPEPKPDAKNTPKSEPKPDSKSVPKPEPNSSPKDIPKPKSKPGQKKLSRRRITTAAAVLVLACGISAWTLIIRPSNDYETAQKLMDLGKYSEAAEAFEALGDYRDSAETALEAQYQNAQALMDSGKYREAAEAFETLGDYQDSTEKAENARREFRLLDAYQDAQVLMDDGKYSEAAEAFEALGEYQDSAEKAEESLYLNAQTLMDDGKYFQAMQAFSELDYKDSLLKAHEAKVAYWETQRNMTLSAGDHHTLGLCDDGSVVAVGSNTFLQCNVSKWTDVVAVSANFSHSVGLRSDGTVVTAGSNNFGACKVDGWTDIIAVSAGDSHTVGLRRDGTVVVTRYAGDGRYNYGQCNVSDWKNIVAIAAGAYHTVGLRSDGTVVATGRNEDGQCDVSDWKNIVAVAAGAYHTVGLRSDGTVVATGANTWNQCDVSSWKNIVAISTGTIATVGLCNDGTVVAAGSNSNGQCDVSAWVDIVAVTAGRFHTVGLHSDGTVVATGYNGDGRCDVSSWKNIRIP